MHPLILDALSKGKDRVAGRINHVSMLDDDRAVVMLDSKQEIHIHVKPEQYQRLQGGLLEEAIFIGVFDLEVLKCETVIFNKRPTNQ